MITVTHCNYSTVSLHQCVSAFTALIHYITLLVQCVHSKEKKTGVKKKEFFDIIQTKKEQRDFEEAFSSFRERCTICRKTKKSTRRVLHHSIRSSVCSFARTALIHSLAPNCLSVHSLAYSLWSSWERVSCLWIECVDSMEFQPTVRGLQQFYQNHCGKRSIGEETWTHWVLFNQRLSIMAWQLVIFLLTRNLPRQKCAGCTICTSTCAALLLRSKTDELDRGAAHSGLTV